MVSKPHTPPAASASPAQGANTSLLSSSPAPFTERGSGGEVKLLLLALLLAALFVISIAVGSVSMPVGDVLTILLGGEPARATWTTIVLDFRLPKAITALLAGAALGVGGLIVQTLFRNPLADPYVLGVSSGASLGVALVVLASGAAGSTMLAGLSFIGDVAVIAAASVGAALVMLLVLLVARQVRSVLTLLILGLMFGYAVGSFVSILMHFAIPERVQAYIQWTFGTFGAVTWSKLGVFALVICLALVMTLAAAKPLNALLLGETYARSMGVEVRRVRVWLLAALALLAGAVTAFCGPIGFLGIAVPHIARMVFRTADHAWLLPACGLLGAGLALLADIIAGVPGSQIMLPLNAVTALLGAPVVVWLLLRSRERIGGMDA
jgi:iron complex transport system permease protein